MARIVLTTPYFITGGTEMMTLSLMSALIAAGHDLSVCCYGTYDTSMRDRVVRSGGRWYHIDAKNERGICRWRAILRMQELFREMQADCVHVQFVNPASIALFARILAGVPVSLLNVHTAGAEGYGRKNRWMFRLTACFATRVVFVSENARQFWMGERTNVKSSVIHNSVDALRFHETSIRMDRALERQRLVIPVDAPVVGIVGRLVDMKGHRDLFVAVRSLASSHPNIRVIVVGDGPESKLLKAFTEELLIAQHVVWAGLVDPDDLMRIYPLFDVLAMPSQWEGFGLAAAEAMAAGVPVVAYRTPGLEEVVLDGVSGLLVPVGDVAALTKAIDQLLCDHDMRKEMGSAGQSRVKCLYNRPVIAAKWQAFYSELGLA